MPQRQPLRQFGFIGATGNWRERSRLPAQSMDQLQMPSLLQVPLQQAELTAQ
jgi:hypothetical protein